jgi:hypothetical protein
MMNYHESWTTEAKSHFEEIIKAHGGWEAWNQLECLSLELKSFKGFLVFVKGLGRTFAAPEQIEVFPKKRRVDFKYPSHTDTFESGKIIYSPEKKTVDDGRTLFRKTSFEKWYPQHAAYFFGYAWANYLSYPFILPEYRLLSWERKQQVTTFTIEFPESLHTHSRVQKFYFNEMNLLSRNDYRAEFAGPLVYGAHHTSEYVNFKGLQVAQLREVYPRLGRVVIPIYGIYAELVVKDLVLRKS